MCDMKVRHDNMLSVMLKECETLPNFLDEVFGFLQRRTDFYVTAYEPNAAIGLQEGVAEKLVRQTFYKWKPLPAEAVYDDTAISTSEELDWTNEELNEVTSTSDKDKPQEKFSVSEYYNGAAYENYCWSQTLVEVIVVVLVPETVTRRGDLTIYNDYDLISVKLKDGTCLLEDELHAECMDSTWSLEGRKVQIRLTKFYERWWSRLLTSEPEFDLSRIDWTRPYKDLSEEKKAEIQEILWIEKKLRKRWNRTESAPSPVAYLWNGIKNISPPSS